jgi:redox-sensitive bicupin YhaK (pirin superfamily)
VHDLLVPVEYLDVRMRPGTVFEHHVPRERHAFAAVFEGAAKVEADTALELPAGGVARPGEGDGFKAIAGGEGARYLLVSGMSLQKPIAWGGPIVMNTQDELDQAFAELDAGTFIR